MVATLTVWQFDTPGGADQAVNTLESLAKQELIKVQDAATVSWPADAKRPKTRQLNNLAGAGAMGGMFWGMLFGLIFFVPFLGAAIGAATGALAGSTSDVGIDDDLIKQARERITPGTSALFAMTSDAVLDKVHEAFAGTGQRPELMYSNLSGEQEAALRDMLAG
jgi:uncharacterized membrane protein